MGVLQGDRADSCLATWAVSAAPQGTFAVGLDGRVPYHVACHRECFEPKCCVCRSFFPQQARMPFILGAFSLE